MATDDTVVLLAAAPAAAYREYLYRPRGRFARWIDDGFEIVARPGQPIDRSPREGDILLEVTLGFLNRGRCSTLRTGDVQRLSSSPGLAHGQLLLRKRQPVEISGPLPVEPAVEPGDIVPALPEGQLPAEIPGRDATAELEASPVEGTAESLVEADDDYAIRGDRYTPQEKQYAATHPSGLVLTSSVIGRLERRLTARAPWTLSVSKEWARFGSGRLGDFVTDYNDFVEYFGEVLAAIGRLQDLLSAGAPELPNLMTSRQKYALRPTTDRPEDTDKKILYRQWRDEQVKYANAEGGILRGLVFAAASTAGQFEEQRHEFWQSAGELKRTIAEAKRLGKNKPTYDALDLSLSDALVLVDPYALAAKTIDIVVDAYQKRKEYDEKMSEFAARVSGANDEVKDRYEKLRDAEKGYWAALLRHRQSVSDRDRTRIEARQKAALLGQKLAPPGEKRLSVLAEIRMPILVADAWHALAAIGPSARAKLDNALKGRPVVEEASRRDLSWRPKSMSGSPANPFADITQIRRAWQQAYSQSSILASDDVEEWTAANNLWDEVFTKFNV